MSSIRRLLTQQFALQDNFGQYRERTYNELIIDTRSWKNLFSARRRAAKRIRRVD